MELKNFQKKLVMLVAKAIYVKCGMIILKVYIVAVTVSATIALLVLIN